MGKGKLTEVQVAKILVRKAEKVPISQIAREFGVSSRTIFRRVRIFEEEERLGKKTYRRDRKFTEETCKQLEDYVKANPFSKLAEIKNDLNLPFTIMSISKYCKQLGLKARVSPKKFLINNLNTDLRLSVARHRRFWPQELEQLSIFG